MSDVEREGTCVLGGTRLETGCWRADAPEMQSVLGISLRERHSRGDPPGSDRIDRKDRLGGSPVQRDQKPFEKDKTGSMKESLVVDVEEASGATNDGLRSP